MAGDRASAAIIDWEGVVRAFLNTSEVRYHDRPFYGSHYACPACSMGRPCPFRDAIRLAEAAVENVSVAEALGADIVEPVKGAVTRGAIPYDPREYGSSSEAQP